MRGLDLGDAHQACLERGQLEDEVAGFDSAFLHDVLDGGNLHPRVARLSANQHVPRRKLAVHERKLMQSGKLRGEAARHLIDPA